MALVRATHSPTVEQVVAKAEGLGMTCTPAAAEVDCIGPPSSSIRNPFTAIRPASGPLSEAVTRVNAHSNGVHDFLSEDRAWMSAIHTVGCADAGGVAKFIDTVAAQFEQSQTGGSYGPLVVGECSMIGSLDLTQFRIPTWIIASRILPSAFPTPTPVPTPPPTPPPVVTPPPTPAPTPTPSPTPTATPSATPTPSPTPAASPTRTPRPSATPEQTVAGITFAPEPSLPQPDTAGDPTGWAASVHDPADVSTDPAAMGVSALLAVLLLLFMGFVGELFNNTVKAHYDELSGWWQKGLIGRLAAAWSAIWKSGP